MLSRQPVIVAGDLSARITLLCQLQTVMMMILVIMIMVMILMMKLMRRVIVPGDLSARSAFSVNCHGDDFNEDNLVD